MNVLNWVAEHPFLTVVLIIVIFGSIGNVIYLSRKG